MKKNHGGWVRLKIFLFGKFICCVNFDTRDLQHTLLARNAYAKNECNGLKKNLTGGEGYLENILYGDIIFVLRYWSQKLHPLE